MIAPRPPIRRFIWPTLVAGLVLGVVLYLAIPAPPPLPVEVAAPTPVLNPDGTVAEVQGVPVQVTTGPIAASAPKPDVRAINELRLREAVFAPFRGIQGRFGIAVKDLATGQTVHLNERFPFQAASLYKLPVMYDVFKLRDMDLLALGDEMTITSEDASMDLGSLIWPIGTRITVGTALDRMVTISDNSGAFMLAKKIGSPRINDDMVALGLELTHVKGGDLQTSAGDMARLLELIARGQALSAETSAEMVHLMARQQVRDRIPVLLPTEAVVANKTGNWEGAAHDVAIVYGPRATFVMALLSDGIVDFDALYSAMSTAARNVYDLVNDPSFESEPSPPLPRNLVGSYVAPAKLPTGTGGASASVPASSTGTGATAPPRPNVSAPPTVVPIRPTPPPQPVDKPRAPQPAATAEAPPAAAPPTAAPARPTPAQLQPKPTARPAEKPAEKPAERPIFGPGAGGGTPAVKPAAPSIFSQPTPAP